MAKQSPQVTFAVNISGEILAIMGMINTVRIAVNNPNEPADATDVEPVLKCALAMLDDLDTKIQNNAYKPQLEAVA